MSPYLFPLLWARRSGAGAVPVFITAAALLISAAAALAEPAWTRTGDCKSCHVANTQTSVLSIVNHDRLTDPDGTDPLPLLKEFRASRGQTGKKLSVQLAGLDSGDTYNVALVRLTDPGVLATAQLDYAADCAWNDWESGMEHVFTPVPRKHVWGSGPTSFDYTLDIPTTAAYDFYDLLFVVAGVKQATGERFYGEEHVYLSVAPPNWAPFVSITAPARNTTFTTPATVTISAKASDPDGTIAKVEFFAGATRLGELTTPPFDFTWSNAPVGNYDLTVKATDNAGATTTSTAVSIVVALPPPVPGDYDHDGDVDQSDFGHLQLCLTGTSGQVSAACTDASLDGDADADAADVTIFLRCLTGEGLPGNPQCAH